MAISYTELVRRVPIWLYAQNRSIVGEMPNIIEEAEEQLMLVLDHDLFRTTLGPFTVGPSAPVLDLSNLPTPVMEVRAINIDYRNGNGYTPMERRDAEALRMMYPMRQPRRPKFYSEDGGILLYEFYPFPDRDYEVNVTANVHPARLSDTQDTSILTEQYPRALEKAVLRQGALFMKNYEDATRYENEMMNSVDEANRQTGRRRRDETGERGRETANAGGM